MSEDEQAAVRKYSRNSPCSVELGCYEGYTSRLLAENTTGMVYTIDPFIKGRLGICYSEWIARLYCRNLRNLHFIRAYSYEVARTFAPNIHFILFDAEFGYEEIRRDLSAWIPKVINGGYVAIHCGSHKKHHYAGLPAMEMLTEVAAVQSLFIYQVHFQQGTNAVLPSEVVI